MSHSNSLLPYHISTFQWQKEQLDWGTHALSIHESVKFRYQATLKKGALLFKIELNTFNPLQQKLYFFDIYGWIKNASCKENLRKKMGDWAALLYEDFLDTIQQKLSNSQEIHLPEWSNIRHLSIEPVQQLTILSNIKCKPKEDSFESALTIS